MGPFRIPTTRFQTGLHALDPFPESIPGETKNERRWTLFVMVRSVLTGIADEVTGSESCERRVG